MWPWGHAALGYLCYALLCRARDRSRPAGWPVVAVAVGTQLPDLVDKPLAWYVHVLPHGRTFAHTLFVAVPAVLVVGWLARRRDRPLAGLGFGVGYLSHLLGDSLNAVAVGPPADLGFLLWPLVAPSPTEVEGLLAHLRNLEGSPFVLFELALAAAAFGLWNAHGRPGLRTLWTVLSR